MLPLWEFPSIISKTAVRKNREYPGLKKAGQEVLVTKSFFLSIQNLRRNPSVRHHGKYQDLKIKKRAKGEISEEEINGVLEKDCLCEGLSAPAILSGGEVPRRNLKAVTICPGPNLAYF